VRKQPGVSPSSEETGKCPPAAPFLHRQLLQQLVVVQHGAHVNHGLRQAKAIELCAVLHLAGRRCRLRRHNALQVDASSLGNKLHRQAAIVAPTQAEGACVAAAWVSWLERTSVPLRVAGDGGRPRFTTHHAHLERSSGAAGRRLACERCNPLTHRRRRTPSISPVAHTERGMQCRCQNFSCKYAQQ
jgi:hypothetical protein